MKLWIVTLENGATHTVYGDDEAAAKEAYWDSLTSIIGHSLGICGCFGPPKPIDRSRFVHPVSVERIA
jgi:hypothetical protein